jgi:hypothetical protein
VFTRRDVASLIGQSSYPYCASAGRFPPSSARASPSRPQLKVGEGDNRCASSWTTREPGALALSELKTDAHRRASSPSRGSMRRAPRRRPPGRPNSHPTSMRPSGQPSANPQPRSRAMRESRHRARPESIASPFLWGGRVARASSRRRRPRRSVLFTLSRSAQGRVFAFARYSPIVATRSKSG